MSIHHMQIGEVADQTGLSLRTIRYYEEMGLVSPSARTSGGFRLYSEADLARLRLIRRMKPLGFSLEEMGQVLGVLDALDTAAPEQRDGLVERLVGYRRSAEEQVTALRGQLETAEGFATDLRREITRQKRMTRNSS